MGRRKKDRPYKVRRNPPRGAGRPRGGRRRFSEVRIRELPESMNFNDLALVLGVDYKTIQQWAFYENMPYGIRNPTGRKQYRVERQDVIQFLIKTKRFRVQKSMRLEGLL